MMNLNQLELNFSDQDVLRNYSLKLAQNLKRKIIELMLNQFQLQTKN
jgi:hypothetical protein